MGFMETSAKLKVNIEETFDLIVRRVIEARRDLGSSPQLPLQRVNNEKKRTEVSTSSLKTNAIEGKDMDSGSCQCCVIS
jgi:GTPase KRas